MALSDSDVSTTLDYLGRPQPLSGPKLALTAGGSGGAVTAPVTPSTGGIVPSGVSSGGGGGAAPSGGVNALGLTGEALNFAKKMLQTPGGETTLGTRGEIGGPGTPQTADTSLSDVVRSGASPTVAGAPTLVETLRQAGIQEDSIPALINEMKSTGLTLDQLEGAAEAAFSQGASAAAPAAGETASLANIPWGDFSSAASAVTLPWAGAQLAQTLLGGSGAFNFTDMFGGLGKPKGYSKMVTEMRKAEADASAAMQGDAQQWNSTYDAVMQSGITDPATLTSLGKELLRAGTSNTGQLEEGFRTGVTVPRNQALEHALAIEKMLLEQGQPGLDMSQTPQGQAIVPKNQDMIQMAATSTPDFSGTEYEARLGPAPDMGPDAWRGLYSQAYNDWLGRAILGLGPASAPGTTGQATQPGAPAPSAAPPTPAPAPAPTQGEMSGAAVPSPLASGGPSGALGFANQLLETP